MLRACVLDFTGSWDKYLALIEFAYNNSYQQTIAMAPYEALYGMKLGKRKLWQWRMFHGLRMRMKRLR